MKKKTRLVRLIDFTNPDKNEFLASNQFEVEYYYEAEKFRRPDLVIFINGIPLAIFEFTGYSFNYGFNGKTKLTNRKRHLMI